MAYLLLSYSLIHVVIGIQACSDKTVPVYAQFVRRVEPDKHEHE